MPVIFANGINMYYETRGDGDPLLLIGGLGMDLTNYRGMVDLLSRKRKVVSFDNRGAGRTDKPDVPYSVDMMAEDTLGLIDGLGVRSCDVVGHSMGGKVALELALRRPEMLRRLVLVSTSARTIPVTMKWRLINLVQRIPAVRSVGTEYPQPYYAYIHQWRASRGYDAGTRLHQVSVPTLILHGTKDRAVPFHLAEEMHAGIPGSKLVSFNGGHLAAIMNPTEVVEAIEDFLDSRATH